MRNLAAEHRFVDRVFMFAGGLLLLGVIAFAVGTELLVLSYYAESPIMFWIWQGVWAVITALIISGLGGIIKKNILKTIVTPNSE